MEEIRVKLHPNCLFCNKVFKARPNKIKVGKDKFCNLVCFRSWQLRQRTKKCPTCNKIFQVKQNNKRTKRYFCSNQCKGKASPSLFKVGLNPWNKGIRNIHFAGKNHWNWKGGITIRKNNDLQWRAIAKECYIRDNWSCWKCGKKCQKVGEIQAHHILPWRLFKEYRYEISNLITLCHSCHIRIERKTALYARY